MALAPAVKGATHTPQRITWSHDDGTAEDLTGATLTGTITDSAGTTRAIAGALTLTTAASGIFTWTYSAADVATAGTYMVQFVAAFGDGTKDKTYKSGWTVNPADS